MTRFRCSSVSTYCGANASENSVKKKPSLFDSNQPETLHHIEHGLKSAKDSISVFSFHVFRDGVSTANSMLNADHTLQPIQRLARKHRNANRSRKNWREILQMFYDDPWFQRCLEKQAQSVIRKHRLQVGDREDIKQEAILLFARCLARDATLGYDIQQGDYGGFLATVILRCCQNGRRQFRNRLALLPRFDPALRGYDDGTRFDRELDVRELMRRLSEPNRSILDLTMDGLSPAEIAHYQKQPKRTISRRLKQAIDRLKRWL